MPVDNSFSIEDVGLTTADGENMLAGNAGSADDNNLTAGEDSTPSNESQASGEEHVAEGHESVESQPDESAPDEEHSLHVNEEGEPETPAQKKSRAQERIRFLADKAKKAEEALVAQRRESEQRFNTLQAQIKEQVEMQTRALQEQLAFQRHQLMQSERLRQEQDFKNLSPAQKIEREFIEKARLAVLPEINATKQQLYEERLARQAIEQKAKDLTQLRYWKSRADRANLGIFFSEFDAETKQALGQIAREMTMTFGTAFGLDPEPASAKLKEFCDAYHRAKLKAVSRRGTEKLKPAQGAPKPLPTGKTSAKGDSRPSYEEIRKLGYNDYVEWRKAQSL